MKSAEEPSHHPAPKHPKARGWGGGPGGCMDRLTLAITSRLSGVTTQSLGDDTGDRCPGCTLRCPFFLPLRHSRAVNEERWAGEWVAETRVPCGYEEAGPESPCAGQTAGQ